MTLNISQIPTYDPQTFSPPNPDINVGSSNQAGMHGSKIIPDSVDLSSTRGGDFLSTPAGYGISSYYQEDVSALLADIKIDYEGKDGSKFFINLSYKAMYKMVHYEVSQASSNVTATPETNPHPLDDYFSPKATSGRIIDFAKTLLGMSSAQDGKDIEKLKAFFDKLIGAIDEGFRQAKKMLGSLPGGISDMIDETHGRIIKGMDQFKDRLFDSGDSTKTTSYYEQASYEACSMEISIEA